MSLPNNCEHGATGWLGHCLYCGKNMNTAAPTPAASAGELRDRVADALFAVDAQEPDYFRRMSTAALAEIAKTHDIVERGTK